MKTTGSFSPIISLKTRIFISNRQLDFNPWLLFWRIEKNLSLEPSRIFNTFRVTMTQQFFKLFTDNDVHSFIM